MDFHWKSNENPENIWNGITKHSFNRCKYKQIVLKLSLALARTSFASLVRGLSHLWDKYEAILIEMWFQQLFTWFLSQLWIANNLFNFNMFYFSVDFQLKLIGVCVVSLPFRSLYFFRIILFGYTHRKRFMPPYYHSHWHKTDGYSGITQILRLY